METRRAVTSRVVNATAALVVLMGGLVGCGSAEEVVRAADAPGPELAPSIPETDEADDRVVAIYAAVLNKIIKPRHPKVVPARDRVYVLEQPRDKFETGDAPPAPTLDKETQARIRAAADVNPPIKWISDADAVRTDGGVGMKRGRMIVTLGTIRDMDEHVLVEYGTWCGNVCGFGTTLILKQSGARWHVTGQTGKAWIS